MATAAKASAARERHVATLKKTIEVINGLTGEACQSTVIVYGTQMESNWQDYASAYDEHEKAIAGKDDTVLKTIADEYLALYTSFVKARIALGKLATPSANPNASFLDMSTSNSGQSTITKSTKLPVCKLPTFSGDFTAWVEFKATVRTLLTDNISEVHRLQCLKEALSGEPRNLVAHILPGTGSFERAMLLLKQEYEHTRSIVNESLRRLYFIQRNDSNRENGATIRSIVNTIRSVTACLSGCDIDVSTWDSILIFNTTQLLHPTTVTAWEESLAGNRTVPALTTYLDFLTTRLLILQSTESFNKSTDVRNKPFVRPSHSQPKEKAGPRMFYTLKTEYKCVICERNHVAHRCDELGRMSVKERRAAVLKHGLCFNCLQPHMLASCPFNATCKKCTEPHHTLLHSGDSARALVTQETVNTVVEEEEPHHYDPNDDFDALSVAAAGHFYHTNDGDTTILATALVPVRWNGRSIVLNALIDQGATANVISERACQMLRLPFVRTHASMTGLGNAPVGCVIGRTSSSIGSCHDKNYNYDITALVVKQVADINPLDCDERKNWSHINQLTLANPNFSRTRRVDLLLGARAYAEIILEQIVKGKPNQPIAQNTKLGWIVFGAAEVDQNYATLCHTLKHTRIDGNPSEDLSRALQSFWELEEVEREKYLTSDEQAAEDLFTSSLKIASDGKFIVDLPFKVDPNTHCLGDSREQADRRLRFSHRRFSKKPEAKKLYDQNLEEYLSLGHMKELEAGEIARNFLPHHPVVKESSSTTKVRTVFDASARTTNGKSLNDILYVGPTIQPELFDLLMQWRRYKYAFCGDIEKMYRQVWVNPEHALFQCILWQPPDSTEIKTFKLLTVTFGTASAPFQAIRALDEIGIRVQQTEPELGSAIRKQFYVDDHLGTANTIEEAVQMRRRLTDELAKYGFNLRKWKANDDRILTDLTNCDKEEVVDFETTFKTLGIAWQPSTDNFQFKSSVPKEVKEWTKRSILSEIAKLYDPLGWLSPCVAKAKMLMQDIWKLSKSFGWDTPVPFHIVTKWQQIYLELCLPIPIQVPRWIGLSADVTCIEIHGFSDASTHAYAAVVYIVIKYNNDQYVSNLLASKTKLAPIKTLSIPRLELCGAVLLSKLLPRCIKALDVHDVRVHAWCDSTVTLAWIAACPSRWTTFVANRVSQVQKALPLNCWNHVPTKSNPADIASRGALVQELASANIWWHGPEFLTNPSLIPIHETGISDDEIPERRINMPMFHVIEALENRPLTYFSTYKRLLKFTVYAMRWRNRTKDRSSPIRAHELTAAVRKWVLIVQGETFAQDIHNIRHDREAMSSVMRQLCPFIDEHSILRMRGRVGNEDLREQKTAIILPAQHLFTTLLMRYAHEEVLHGGVQLTLRYLREQFWIIHGRNEVKKLIHKCVTCFRYRKRFMKQKMAELPSFRTEQARPFAFVGCDYAGPFQIKLSNRRNSPTTKGYIALFICLTTKALHLEVVLDLSTAEFVMAFENFIARRGIPVMLYTDNGTNFIGGSKEISSLFQQLMSQNNALSQLFAMKNIQFKTIPARASHMGGIWERAVGSVKYHLRRVLKDTKLNARQFDHVLKQIEACLNSRPLWAMTNESDDVEVLIPSHFFNFKAINTLPRPDLQHIPLTRLDQYQYLHELYCSFWRTWSKEYLHQFQIRPKWNREHPNAIIGQIVLVSEDNLPPSQWAFGKIVGVHPGKDDLVRSVEVKCGKTVLRRPVHKLALLPIPENESLELLEKAQRGENVAERQEMS